METTLYAAALLESFPAPSATRTVAEEVRAVHDKALRETLQVGANSSRTQRADEMQRIAFGAAAPVTPGESVKAQMLRAWRALGKPPYWRLKDAWLGYAGKWRDEAVDDFRQRAQALAISRAAEQVAEAGVEGDAGAAMASRLAALCEALEAQDADFHRQTVDALRWAIGRCRG